MTSSAVQSCCNLGSNRLPPRSERAKTPCRPAGKFAPLPARRVTIWIQPSAILWTAGGCFIADHVDGRRHGRANVCGKRSDSVVSNNTYWNVDVNNGYIATDKIRLDNSGCLWTLFIDSDNVWKMKCPYVSSNERTMVATANGSQAGSRIAIAASTLPNQHSSVDIHSIDNNMSRIYFNKINKYAYNGGTYPYVTNYNESSQSQKWYLVS